MSGVEKLNEIVDPGGLIRESFLMKNLSPAEAKSIFIDWSMKLKSDVTDQIALKCLLEVYDTREYAKHPMLAILREGLEQEALSPQGRTGGSRARHALLRK